MVRPGSGRGSKAHASETTAKKPIILLIAGVIAGGIVATFLSLYAGSCHLPISQGIADNPELAQTNPVCQFGFPRAVIRENRFSDLSVPDDSSVHFQVFLGPSFVDSDFSLAAATFDVVAWSLALGACAAFLGPRLSRRRMKQLLIPSAAATIVMALFVVRAEGIASATPGKIDFLAGWPVGWIVFGRETTAAFFPTRIDQIHLVRGAISVTVIWLALAFLASWIHEERRES